MLSQLSDANISSTIKQVSIIQTELRLLTQSEFVESCFVPSETLRMVLSKENTLESIFIVRTSNDYEEINTLPGDEDIF